MRLMTSCVVVLAVLYVACPAWADQAAAPAAVKAPQPMANATPLAESLLKENRDGTFSMVRTFMGKEFSFITADEMEEAKVKEAFEAGFEEVARLEKLTDSKDATSGMGLINAKAGIEPVVVDPELFDMISRALEVSTITKGAFDITFASLGDLWDFNKVPFTLPKESDIKARLPLVSYANVELDERKSTVFLKKTGVRIGLKGIAQGYAADKAAYVLQRKGLNNFIVSAGGDLMIMGRKKDKNWNVGIQDPFFPDTYLGTLPVSNKAVVTSGDYERGFWINDKYYHHIIDTKTGNPASECHQVTIIADYATYADALATGIFVLGPNVGLPLIEKMPGVDAVIIDQQGNVFATSGVKDAISFKKKVNLPRPPVPQDNSEDMLGPVEKKTK